jgi:hypothetical protein
MCLQSCSLATVLVLSPVYTTVTWQWVYMSQYNSHSKQQILPWTSITVSFLAETEWILCEEKHKFIKIKLTCCYSPPIYHSKLCSSQLIRTIKNPAPLSQAATSNYSNAFTFMMDGRARSGPLPAQWCCLCPKMKCLYLLRISFSTLSSTILCYLPLLC